MLSKVKTHKAIKKHKEFDAVKMMREIREELSQKYWRHPDILKKEMEAVRKKYNIKQRPSKNT